MDKTYVKVKTQWMYQYRAIDKNAANLNIFEQFFSLTKRIQIPKH